MTSDKISSTSESLNALGLDLAFLESLLNQTDDILTHYFKNAQLQVDQKEDAQISKD